MCFGVVGEKNNNFDLQQECDLGKCTRYLLPESLQPVFVPRPELCALEPIRATTCHAAAEVPFPKFSLWRKEDLAVFPQPSRAPPALIS